MGKGLSIPFRRGLRGGFHVDLAGEQTGEEEAAGAAEGLDLENEHLLLREAVGNQGGEPICCFALRMRRQAEDRRHHFCANHQLKPAISTSQ